MRRPNWDQRRAQQEDFQQGYLMGKAGLDYHIGENGTGCNHGGYQLGKEEFEITKNILLNNPPYTK